MRGRAFARFFCDRKKIARLLAGVWGKAGLAIDATLLSCRAGVTEKGHAPSGRVMLLHS